MIVWIDQDICTGCSLCEQITPEIFAMVDGVAYVKEGGRVLAGGPEGRATVPTSLETSVTEAARETPGECIFVEIS